MIGADDHWCFLCAALDGVAAPSDEASAGRQQSMEQRVATLEAKARERERKALTLARKQARETAGLLRRRATAQRRTEREASAPGFATEEQLSARWTYYGGRCWMCRNPAAHMDHVKPLAAGGSQWPSNQRPACWPCNQRKGARWPYLIAA